MWKIHMVEKRIDSIKSRAELDMIAIEKNDDSDKYIRRIIRLAENAKDDLLFVNESGLEQLIEEYKKDVRSIVKSFMEEKGGK